MEFFFRRDQDARKSASRPSASPQPPRTEEGPPDPDRDEDGSGSAPLTQLLEREDRAALASALESAARKAQIEKIRLVTQKNLYVRQILERMGLREVEERIVRLRQSDQAGDYERGQRLEAALQQLRDSARDQVERAMLLYARTESEQLRERMLKSARLANIDPSQHERMRTLLRRMAKRIATRYALQRRRRERGQLDIRRTLRRNMGWGGVPFVTCWKQRRVEKPRVMVLCDVSGSVAWVAQFLLMFIYALTEVLSDIRSFVYTSSLIEVSDILEDHGIDDAIERVTDAMGFGTSNYGTSFADFEDGWMRDVTTKTTVIVLGDARGNGTDPRTDIVERLAQRSKRIIWLNPEPRSAWGTGDSDMDRYAPYCSPARVCATLNDLERVIIDLLDAN